MVFSLQSMLNLELISLVSLLSTSFRVLLFPYAIVSPLNIHMHKSIYFGLCIANNLNVYKVPKLYLGVIWIISSSSMLSWICCSNFFLIILAGLGFITSITFIFLIGVFMSSWLGASVLSLGEWFIKRMPFVRHIYNASKQISAAISPGESHKWWSHS